MDVKDSTLNVCASVVGLRIGFIDPIYPCTFDHPTDAEYLEELYYHSNFANVLTTLWWHTIICKFFMPMNVMIKANYLPYPGVHHGVNTR